MQGIVCIKNAVEMIAFMLENHGRESRYMLHSVTGRESTSRRERITYVNLTVTEHISPPARNTKASLRSRHQVSLMSGDIDIRIHLERLPLLVETLYRDNPPRYPHLRPCNPHSFLLRRSHRRYHLGSQCLVILPLPEPPPESPGNAS